MQLKKILLLILASSATSVYAGAFSLYTESSPAAIANFAAGIGAEGRDAAVGYYNPAALVLLKRPEFVGGGAYVIPTANLSGSTTFTQNLGPFGVKQLKEPLSPTDGGRTAIVPSFHVAIPGGERVTYGLSVVAPLGLATNWPSDSPLRYQATYTHLTTTELSPQMGGLITDNIAVGLGTNFQWANVNYNSVLGAPTLPQIPRQYGGTPYPTYLDTTTSNHGNSFGIGFHAGVLLKTDDNRSRLGVSYSYGVTQQFYGSSALEGRLAGGQAESYFRSPGFRTDPVKFPDILNFSLYQQINDKTAMLGSIVYTLWSTYDQIIFDDAALPGSTATKPVFRGTSAISNYRNTVRAAFGMNHQLTEQWEFRWGGGYDQTPTNPEYRDIRLPDVDRLSIGTGLHWQTNQYLGWDVGYSYLFPLSSTEIHRTQVFSPNASDRVDVSGHSYAQVIGAQVVVRA